MNDKADKIMAILHDLTATEQIAKVSQVDKITIANKLASYATLPPPEAFGLTQVRRGDLSLIEASAGFFLYHNPTKQTRWISDGVFMFYNDDQEAISPGVMEWWFAAYEWLSDETELIEAYFPEVIHDNM